ncbi:MAG: hypothetical protein OEY85_13245, partial [Rhodospirillales bacterium]|nr:hypothetical protein [Rhodospirillales bacterium]
AAVEMRQENRDASVFWRQLRQQRITHLLLSAHQPSESLPGRLLRNRCLIEVRKFTVNTFASRTLPGPGLSQQQWALYRLTPEACPFAAKPPYKKDTPERKTPS